MGLAALRIIDLYALLLLCAFIPDSSDIGGLTSLVRTTTMNADVILGLTLSVLLLVYLAYALLKAEKF